MDAAQKIITVCSLRPLRRTYKSPCSTIPGAPQWCVVQITRTAAFTWPLQVDITHRFSWTAIKVQRSSRITSNWRIVCLRTSWLLKSSRKTAPSLEKTWTISLALIRINQSNSSNSFIYLLRVWWILISWGWSNLQKGSLGWNWIWAICKYKPSETFKICPSSKSLIWVIIAWLLLRDLKFAHLWNSSIFNTIDLQPAKNS